MQDMECKQIQWTLSKNFVWIFDKKLVIFLRTVNVHKAWWVHLNGSAWHSVTQAWSLRSSEFYFLTSRFVSPAPNFFPNIGALEFVRSNFSAGRATISPTRSPSVGFYQQYIVLNLAKFNCDLFWNYFRHSNISISTHISWPTYNIPPPSHLQLVFIKQQYIVLNCISEIFHSI